jgi:hypothetical protein
MLQAPVEIRVEIPKFRYSVGSKSFLQGTGVVTRINADAGFAAQVKFQLWRVDAKGIASSLG